MVEIMEKKSSGLVKQLDSARLENNKLSDNIISLKRQLKQRDEEITALRRQKNNNAIGTVIRETCCQCQQKDRKIEVLQKHLDEAVDKQHEAMSRAVQLAERNQLLERELQELNKLALCLEDNYRKGESHCDESINVKLTETLGQIKELEGRLKEVRERLEAESAVTDILRKERDNLQEKLAMILSEKKELQETNFLLQATEKMLNNEMMRLRESNMTLHQRWKSKDPWLECKELACTQSSTCPCKCPAPMRSTSSLGCISVKNKRLRNKIEPKVCGCAPSILLLDKLQKERDFYHNECHNLREQIENIPLPSACCNKISSKDDERITNFRTDSVRLLLESSENNRKRVEEELREIRKERDCLIANMQKKCNCQLETNIQITRLERVVSEGEEKIRKLESERRDLLGQCEFLTTRIKTVEKRCDDYRNQFEHTNTMYLQMKATQEVRDVGFNGTQSKLSLLEADLNFTKNKLKDAEAINKELDERISILSKEKSMLSQNLSTLEREKDQLVMVLDQKTEKLVKLESEIKRRDMQLVDASAENKESHRKMDLLISEKTSRDHIQRTLELSVQRLEEEVAGLRVENRRLQEDLANALRDGKSSRIEADNLKKQLQHYVSEVKKTEELISQKEKEQNDMLQNFHTLTLEASSLENSNHTLESEVEVSRAQLNRLKLHINGLEDQLSQKHCGVDTLEKQVNSLKSHIAELESRLEIQYSLRKRAEADLDVMRALCQSIDEQKESIQKRADNIDEDKVHIMYNIKQLSEEKDCLTEELRKEKSAIEGLRHSLTLSRQETMKHQMSNKELSAMLKQLKKQVDELGKESGDVRRYQEQCADLSQQVTELRRELTNVKFDYARQIHQSADREISRSSDNETSNCNSSGRELLRIPLPSTDDNSLSSLTSCGNENISMCDNAHAHNRQSGPCFNHKQPFTYRMLIDDDFEDNSKFVPFNNLTDIDEEFSAIS